MSVDERGKDGLSRIALLLVPRARFYLSDLVGHLPLRKPRSMVETSPLVKPTTQNGKHILITATSPSETNLTTGSNVTDATNGSRAVDISAPIVHQIRYLTTSAVYVKSAATNSTTRCTYSSSLIDLFIILFNHPSPFCHHYTSYRSVKYDRQCHWIRATRRRT